MGESAPRRAVIIGRSAPIFAATPVLLHLFLAAPPMSVDHSVAAAILRRSRLRLWLAATLGLCVTTWHDGQES